MGTSSNHDMFSTNQFTIYADSMRIYKFSMTFNQVYTVAFKTAIIRRTSAINIGFTIAT